MNLNGLEQELAGMFRRNYCLMVGSGTTALILLFKALNLNQQFRPLFPAVSCISAFNSAIFANTYPEFTDISLSDYTMHPEKLRQILHSNPNIKAIVPTNLFGHLYDAKEIHPIADEYGVFVIEDAAQSMGALMSNDDYAATGHASIISFGHTKIADAGHGGAILTNDSTLYRDLVKLNFLESKTVDLVDIELLANEYRTQYYQSITEGTAWDLSSSRNLRYLHQQYKQCFHFPFNVKYLPKIVELLPKLAEENRTRQAKASLYRQYLKRSDITFSEPREGSVVWRFTFRINEKYRDSLLSYLRAKNIHCSSWYPYYPRLYGDVSHVHSLTLEREVVNLWVDSTYSETEIKQICETINRWEGGLF